MNGRFREGSIFEWGQRDTPHPMPIDIFPRSGFNFNICDNIRVVSDYGSIFGNSTQTVNKSSNQFEICEPSLMRPILKIESWCK